MPFKTMEDLFEMQLNELYAAEKHSLEVLPKMAKAASNPKLATIMRDHLDQTRTHIKRLDTVFGEIGIRPKDPTRSESKGMKGLCQDCLKLAEAKNADPHVRDAALVAVAQHVEHDEIAGYGCAKTWAGLLGYDKPAQALQATLTEERKTDTELTRLAESLNKQALAAAAG